MAIYEYYCPTCRNRFELRRPMSEASMVATCVQGHKSERTLSAFAMARGGSEPSFEAGDMGGGCCGGGGGCACRSAN
jgi:putative FmdB family regulatory protein